MPRRELSYAGLLAEFETPQALLDAARAVRAAGLTHVEAYTPFAVPEVEEALALPRSPIARIVFVAGLIGAISAYAFLYWVTAVDDPRLVGGMPAHSGPAYIPITFETMVLFASVTAFLSFFALSRLPRLWHPVFEAEGFESATVHRFWLGIDARDPALDVSQATRLLVDAGALRVVRGAEP